MNPENPANSNTTQAVPGAFMQPSPKPASEKEIIVVTGSSGLIGKAVIHRLHPAYQIIGLDKEGFPFPPPVAECINVDITSLQSIQEAMQKVHDNFGNRIASVIHLAAYYDFTGKPSPLYDEITVRGTEKLLQVLQDFEVQQFIFSSSMLVYKPTKPGLPINEQWPQEPSWDYPKSKVETEKIIHQKRGTIPAVILRIAGVYNEEGNSIPVTNQIQRIYERTLTSHLYSGDTSSGNTFIHLDDLADAIVQTVENRQRLPAEIALNIGEERPVSYEELQQTIGHLVHDKDWKTFEIPKPLAKAGAAIQDIFGDPFIKPWMIDKADDHYELDISLAKKTLGWSPRHSLLATLPAMVQELKTDPASWYKKNKLEPPSDLPEKSTRSAGK